MSSSLDLRFQDKQANPKPRSSQNNAMTCCPDFAEKEEFATGRTEEVTEIGSMKKVADLHLLFQVHRGVVQHDVNLPDPLLDFLHRCIWPQLGLLFP